MSASPSRPAQPVAEIGDRSGDQGREQVLDLVAGQRDQPGRRRSADAFGHGRQNEEGMGEHGQGDPPVPGAPAADLVLVQADQALPVWNRSSTVHLVPATRTSVASDTGQGIQQR